MSVRIAGVVPVLFLTFPFATPTALAQAGAGALEEVVVTATG